MSEDSLYLRFEDNMIFIENTCMISCAGSLIWLVWREWECIRVSGDPDFLNLSATVGLNRIWDRLSLVLKQTIRKDKISKFYGWGQVYNCFWGCWVQIRSLFWAKKSRLLCFGDALIITSQICSLASSVVLYCVVLNRLVLCDSFCSNVNLYCPDSHVHLILTDLNLNYTWDRERSLTLKIAVLFYL